MMLKLKLALVTFCQQDTFDETECPNVRETMRNANSLKPISTMISDTLPSDKLFEFFTRIQQTLESSTTEYYTSKYIVLQDGLQPTKSI